MHFIYFKNKITEKMSKDRERNLPATSSLPKRPQRMQWVRLEPGASSGSPLLMQEPKDLGHPSSISHVKQQGAGSEVDQDSNQHPYEMPVSQAGRGLTYNTTINTVPKLTFLNNKMESFYTLQICQLQELAFSMALKTTISHIRVHGFNPWVCSECQLLAKAGPMKQQ